MSVNEAAKLLDVAPDADADAINAAHRRLIAKVHPDAGGTAELAARVNQARDLLLKRLR
jgi:DnaJ homolog subfamily C member 19